MKRPSISFALSLGLTAAIACHPLKAAEQSGPVPGPAPAPSPAPRPPRPGLEIFEGAAPVSQDPERAAGDALSDPYAEPPVVQPPYQPPQLGRAQPPAPAEPPPSPVPEQPFGSDVYTGPYDPAADPFANLDDTPTPPPAQVPYPSQAPYPAPLQDPYAAQPQGQPADPYFDPYGQPPQAPAWTGPAEVVEPYATAPVVIPVMQNFNTRNPLFPGLPEAVSQNSLPGAGSSIWEVLKQRRIVEAAMTRGVRGSVGVSTPYDMQRLAEIVNQMPRGSEDALMPAFRVNVILDSFQQPLIEDFGYASLMPQLLVRLNEDVQAVRHQMNMTNDDGVYLELARTYVRAATTCDFFAFPRRQLAGDVRDVMRRAGGMFYPDGSSMAGDVGGITGNLFQILLMMDYYSRSDSWFRRDLGSMWNVLEKPAKYLQEVLCPNLSLPRFGARGTRELGPGDLATLAAVFPKDPPRVGRIGLAASSGYPRTSTQSVYGGVFVSRESDDPNARYLAVRFGPRSAVLGVPTHNDFGSLELVSRGVKYLMDPGGYGGVSATGAAHGGMSLNGKYVQENSMGEPGVPAEAIWRTNASIDYATGMAAYEDTKTWQRSVLYVKNLPGETRADYWLVLDQMDMKNDPQPQASALRFQFAPGIQAYSDGAGVIASAGPVDSGLRIFAVDAGVRLEVTDGNWNNAPGQVFDAYGGMQGAPSLSITRNLVGDSSAATIFYPVDSYGHRPLRIERDSDIIRGRTGAIVVDHGMERIDVIAWAPPGTELVTPTLSLQLSADLAVFRLRRGRFARIDFVNLERFQAKEPEGGLWSMRVNGPAQTCTIEAESGGGWQVLSDPANKGAADMLDVNFGPAVSRRKFSIKPGDLRVITR